jgi:hypothetical protein
MKIFIHLSFQPLIDLNLQAIGHKPSQALEVNLFCDVLGLDRLFLLDDGDNVSLHVPVVLLDPLRELLVVNVYKELREINLVDSLEGRANNVTDELSH